MIELSEEDHATAKKLAAKFEDGSADDVVQPLFEALRHEEGGPAPFLGLRVSKNVALTPNDSGLAQAVWESSLPIETRELFIRGNEYLLFARPPVEKIVHSRCLADHLAKQMARKFEKGCEGPIFTDVRPGEECEGPIFVRPGKEEASSLRIRPDRTCKLNRTYLVLDRAGSEERATFLRGKHPLEKRTIGGENYILYGCREITLNQHPVLARRSRRRREKGMKRVAEFLERVDLSPEERRKQTLHQVGDQLGLGEGDVRERDTND